MNDLRFAFRQLLKNPAFTAVAVLTLALSIGATTAITSVVRTALFDPLPMAHPERFLSLYAKNTKAGWQANGLNPIAAREVEAATNLFRTVALSETDSLTIEGGDFPQPLGTFRVTDGFFRLTGVPPLLGRLPSTEEYRVGASGVLVLGHWAWQSFFGGDPAVVGRRVRFKEGTFEVIGVMPTEFRFPSQQGGSWVAWSGPGFRSGDAFPENRSGSLPNVLVNAELQPGVNRGQAQAWLDVIQAREAQLDVLQKEFRFMAQDLGERFSRPELRRTLWALLAVIVIVLLIAAANLANLQLARLETRRPELAVRAALGAGRRRVFRQLLVENLLLATLGGAAGLLVTWFGLDLLTSLLPGELPRLRAIQLDLGVLAVASVLTLTTGVLSGVVPAWRGGKANLNETLKLGGAGATAGRRRLSFTGALVVGQVALALMLLTGAGLMVRSVHKLLTVDVGFNPDHLIKLYPPIDLNRYVKDDDNGMARVEAVYEDLRQRFAALPGVEAVGLSQAGGQVSEVTTEAGVHQELSRYLVGTGAADPLRVLQARLKAGRWLTVADAQAGNVVLLNEAAARRLWPSGRAVGERLRIKGAEKLGLVEVVGVVGDLREDAYAEEPGPTFFAPVRSMEIFGPGRPLVIRTKVHYELLRPALERELKAVGAGESRPYLYFVDEMLYASTAGQRTFMNYLLTFAGTGLVLSALGLYGVLAFSVARRTREIGIRMALGAARREVIELVVGQGMRLAIIGLVLGVAGALVAGRLLRSFLFGVAPNDFLTFVGVAALLSVVALFACWLPARRAARVDPMVALRSE